MVHPKRGDTLQQALDVVLRQLERVPEGPELAKLRECARDLQQALEGRAASPPSAMTRNLLQKRMLSLHLAARKLTAR